MSEQDQSRRLHEAELRPGAHLWASLESRLPQANAQPEPARRNLAGWYWAAAACLLMALGAIGGTWKASRAREPLATLAPLAPLAPGCQSAAGFSFPSHFEIGFIPTVSCIKVMVASGKARTVCTVTTTVTTITTSTTTSRHSFRSLDIDSRHDGHPQMCGAPPIDATSSEAQTPAQAAYQAGLGLTVAQFNAPRLILPPADSLMVISPAIGSQTDSLTLLLALSNPRGRDSVKSGKRQGQRPSIINKLNRALRWLPGGSAWPSIRFEKAEVAATSPPPRYAAG